MTDEERTCRCGKRIRRAFGQWIHPGEDRENWSGTLIELLDCEDGSGRAEPVEEDFKDRGPRGPYDDEPYRD